MSSNALRGGFERVSANQSYGKPICAVYGTTPAQVQTTAAFTYSINGINYSKAAIVNVALALPPVAQVPNIMPFHAVGSTTVGLGLITFYILLIINSAGTVYAVQGDEKGRDLSPFGRPDKGTGFMPDVPDAVPTATPLTDGFAPFGLIKVVVNNLQTFLPGTDALNNATKGTYTFYDIATIPSVAP
jgi:hypothetical protein